MLIDGNIGGSIDGTGGANLDDIREQVELAEQAGFDGVWSTEVSRDPFLPLLLAAENAPRLHVGTAIAVAFARSPMTLATVANDMQSFSSGRFTLGLGSQIKPHIERRFSMPWSAPAPRMREFVNALRAIWDSWQNDTPLDFRGDFYSHTLMTPMFRPPRNEFGPPQVIVAAVGPQMTSVAAEAADGMLVHGFTTERYLREVTVPQIESALAKAGKTFEDFTLSYPGLVVTGSDERQFEEAAPRCANRSRSTGPRRRTGRSSTSTVGVTCRPSPPAVQARRLGVDDTADRRHRPAHLRGRRRA